MSEFIIMGSVEGGRKVGGRWRSGIVQGIELLNTTRVSLLTLSMSRGERETGFTILHSTFLYDDTSLVSSHKINFRQINEINSTDLYSLYHLKLS